MTKLCLWMLLHAKVIFSLLVTVKRKTNLIVKSIYIYHEISMIINRLSPNVSVVSFPFNLIRPVLNLA